MSQINPVIALEVLGQFVSQKLIAWIVDYLNQEECEVNKDTLNKARLACIKHHAHDVNHGTASQFDANTLKNSMQPQYLVSDLGIIEGPSLWASICKHVRDSRLKRQNTPNVSAAPTAPPAAPTTAPSADPPAAPPAPPDPAPTPPAAQIGKRKRTKPVEEACVAQRPLSKMDVVKPKVQIGQNKKGLVLDVQSPTTCTVVWLLSPNKLGAELCIPSNLIICDDPFPIQLEKGTPIRGDADLLLSDYIVNLSKSLNPNLKCTNKPRRSIVQWWNGHNEIRKPPELKLDSAFVRNMIAICKDEKARDWMFCFWPTRDLVRGLVKKHDMLQKLMDTSGLVRQVLGYFEQQKRHQPMTDAEKDALFQKTISDAGNRTG